MTDKEKTIACLECRAENKMMSCTTCPYKATHDGFAVCDFSRLCRDALELLKAQDETRLVRHFCRPNVYEDLWQHCEMCGEKVDTQWHPKYCPGCGRRAKWE